MKNSNAKKSASAFIHNEECNMCTDSDLPTARIVSNDTIAHVCAECVFEIIMTVGGRGAASTPTATEELPAN